MSSDCCPSPTSAPGFRSPNDQSAARTARSARSRPAFAEATASLAEAALAFAEATASLAKAALAFAEARARRSHLVRRSLPGARRSRRGSRRSRRWRSPKPPRLSPKPPWRSPKPPRLSPKPPWRSPNYFPRSHARRRTGLAPLLARAGVSGLIRLVEVVGLGHRQLGPGDRPTPLVALENSRLFALLEGFFGPDLGELRAGEQRRRRIRARRFRGAQTAPENLQDRHDHHREHGEGDQDLKECEARLAARARCPRRRRRAP